MNQEQSRYIAARAAVGVLNNRLGAVEHDIIAYHGIINPDGNIPNRLDEIVSIEAFDKVADELERRLQDNGLDSDLDDAREALRVAENELIVWLISIMPEEDRALYLSAYRTRATMRNKLLELALKRRA